MQFLSTAIFEVSKTNSNEIKTGIYFPEYFFKHAYYLSSQSDVICNFTRTILSDTIVDTPTTIALK